MTPRVHKLIHNAIKTLELDLTGLTVLTECASGWYSLTPVIAAVAGAKKVIALGKDTRYGTFESCCDQVNTIATELNVADKICFTNDRSSPVLKEADIVTNLGMLRPLDKMFLAQLKPTCVIPLMWETWEFRPEDLDLEECKRLGIPVIGTNEHHPDLQIFPYVGWLAVKLLFECGIEVFRSKIIVLGHGEFAELSQAACQSAGAETLFIDTNASEALLLPQNRNFLEDADAILVMDHHSRKMIIGKDASITPKMLHELNPYLTVVHVSGGVSREELLESSITCWPEKFAPAGYMSAATDYLGPRPMIDLHTAGLKVGELSKRDSSSNEYKALMQYFD